MVDKSRDKYNIDTSSNRPEYASIYLMIICWIFDTIDNGGVLFTLINTFDN